MSKSNAELIRRLIRRNEALISWLGVVIRADCRHVGLGNVSTAGELVEGLKEENELHLKLLVELADKEVEL